MKQPDTMRVYYRLTVKDKNGNIISQTRLRKSHSFVKNFLVMIEALCSNSTDSIINITGGDSGGQFIWASAYASVSGVMGAFNESNRGIVVGTSDTTPTNTDYELNALIVAGSSSDQMIYTVQSVVPPAEIAGNIDYKFIRVFSNSSGGLITVKEIGVHIAGYYGNFLAIHDVVSPQAVADGNTLTVEYVLRTTA